MVNFTPFLLALLYLLNLTYLTTIISNYLLVYFMFAYFPHATLTKVLHICKNLLKSGKYSECSALRLGERPYHAL